MQNGKIENNRGGIMSNKNLDQKSEVNIINSLRYDNAELTKAYYESLERNTELIKENNELTKKLKVLESIALHYNYEI